MTLSFYACQKETAVANHSNDIATESVLQDKTDHQEGSNNVASRGETDVAAPCNVTVKVTVSGPSEYEVKVLIKVGSTNQVLPFNGITHPQGVYTYVCQQSASSKNQEIKIFNPYSSFNNSTLPWFHTYLSSAYVKIDIIPENGLGYTYLMNSSNGKPTNQYSYVYNPKTLYSVSNCTVIE